ncbi:MAG: hypothetical protein JRJ23_11665, partial [Deltaproteobacteria bacterium]|nr:hypothetical protein [Deltaproteobacteria bacterium]
MRKKRNYEYKSATKLRRYVTNRYREQLKPGSLHLYWALAHLEEDGLGLCQPITANYRKLSEASIVSISSIKPALKELDRVLCEVKIGDPIKANMKATQIRRFTLSELMNGEPKQRLIDYTPPNAIHLAELLKDRDLIYGTERITPNWNVTKTGRVQSARPNIQGDSKNMRAEYLCTGLGQDQVLIHADFKSAEPSILQQTIGDDFIKDPYTLLANFMDIDRSEAKGKINMLAYGDSAIKTLKYWPPNAQDSFRVYAETLDRYKEKLWKIGKPRNGQRRFVHTLGGSKIIAKRGIQSHRGQILNWQIQGTVANILNGACLKIIAQEDVKGWRFCIPVHDAVYLIGKPEQEEEIKAIMEDEAKQIDLSLDVEIQIFKDGGAVIKLNSKKTPLLL